MAIDDLEFAHDDECDFEPKEAFPTTPTTESTTTATEPPQRKMNGRSLKMWKFPHKLSLYTADFFCNFEVDYCDWVVTNTLDYVWSRTTAELLESESVPGPQNDHNGERSKYFLIASDYMAGPLAPEGAESVLESQVFLGRDHPVECFRFFFYFGVRLKISLSPLLIFGFSPREVENSWWSMSLIWTKTKGF